MQKSIPPHYQQVMPYLIVSNPKGLIHFIEDVFEGKMVHESYHDDGNLMHGEIQIGHSTLMLAQSNKDWKENPAGLFVFVDDADLAYARAMELGSVSILPLENKDYGRTCGVQDPNGIIWWITSPL